MLSKLKNHCLSKALMLQKNKTAIKKIKAYYQTHHRKFRLGLPPPCHLLIKVLLRRKLSLKNKNKEFHHICSI